jgi:hypothetical protein
MQSVSSSLPVTSMYLPAAQSMQSDGSSLPAKSMYLPATHATQPAGAEKSDPSLEHAIAGVPAYPAAHSIVPRPGTVVAATFGTT